MRLASFMHTQDQLRNRSKDVTRRVGWRWARPGMFLLAVSKCMGLRAGEVAEIFGVIKIVHVSRERLDAITADDVRREGFPDLTPADFVAMFCRHMHCAPDTEVARIVFRHATLAEADAALRNPPP